MCDNHHIIENAYFKNFNILLIIVCIFKKNENIRDYSNDFHITGYSIVKFSLCGIKMNFSIKKCNSVSINLFSLYICKSQELTWEYF